jgi:hypothetical protein
MTKDPEINSTEELRRQYDAAKSRTDQARMAENEAFVRLIKRLIEEAEADFAAKGMPKGAQVVSKSYMASDPHSHGIYMGHRQFGLDIEPVVHKIKADGKPHATARIFGLDWHPIEGDTA